MSEVSIKVNIGSRTYPLSVKPAEEEVVRTAAKNVNESIKVLQDNYAVKDMQDLLAMTALQVSTQLLVKKQEKPKEDPRLAKLDQNLTDYLNRQ
ncbi:MAG: cell division protein ZapA [Bacteroidota bacterium]